MTAKKKRPSRNKRACKPEGKTPAPPKEKALQPSTRATPEILEKARTQWQFGDWASLCQLTPQAIDTHPERARLALYAAAGHLQRGQTARARNMVQLARQWGVTDQELRSVLVSGVYNSLARARLIQGRQEPAAVLMQAACRIGMPNADDRLLLAARLAFQAAQLGLPQPRIRSAVEALPRTTRERLAGAKKRLQSTSSAGDEFTERLYAILENLTDSVLRQGRDMVLDGVRVFDTKDPFRPGKLALAMSYRVTACEPGSAEQVRACRQFDRIAELTRDDPQETWGIYFYLLALVRLKSHGLLEKALAPFRRDQLRQRLDWRGFIEEQSYRLKNKPNNFYGVAFGIAEHRAALGWDDPVHGEILLQKMLHHYRTHSGQHGFADETEGQGRYDRYSVLLVAEIAQRFRETGRPLTPELQTWLRNAAQFVLVNLNETGDGFLFGRSIGAYGDSAFLEILSAAAWHGVLTPVETRMAYAFARRATRKFLDFWYDSSRQSVNLWEDGRATDGYRNKQRILGEDLSLLHQHIYTHRIWEQLQLRPSPELHSEFSAWLAQLPSYTLTRFSNDKHAKAALTVRDGQRLFSLWLVNPANYHANGAYTPAPFSSGLIQAIPDASVYPLLPLVELDDGSLLMPMAYFDDIHLEESGEHAVLLCRQSGLASVHEGQLRRDVRLAVQTRFEFSSGCIRRQDEFRITEGCAIASVRLCFPTTLEARMHQGAIRLGHDDSATFQVEGYESLEVHEEHGSDIRGTPAGPIRAEIRAHAKNIQQENARLTVSWTLNYR